MLKIVGVLIGDKKDLSEFQEPQDLIVELEQVPIEPSNGNYLVLFY